MNETRSAEEWRGRLGMELEGREEGYVDNGRLIVGRKPQAVLRHIVEQI